MKNKCEVIVAGISVTLLSEEEEEYVKKLAKVLDRRVMELTIDKNRFSKSEALILCALDYLDETVKLRDELAALKGERHERNSESGE